MAAFLLSGEDRGGEGPLYNVDHLLELWDEIHSRLPKGRLWLVGEASDRIRQRVEGRADIVLFGRVPREQALATAANFDIALYPRTEDTGIQAAKVGEFIGLGVPTVSYDYEVTENLRESGAGLLVADAARVRRRGRPPGRGRRGARLELAAAAKQAGAALDWDVLARRYEEKSSTGISRAARRRQVRTRPAAAAGVRNPLVLRRRGRTATTSSRQQRPRARPSGSSSSSVSGSATRATPTSTSNGRSDAREHRLEGRPRERCDTERRRRRDEHRHHVEEHARRRSGACSAPRPRSRPSRRVRPTGRCSRRRRPPAPARSRAVAPVRSGTA